MADRALTDWLLDSDPALRWQVERDLLGARLLALQDPDGQWAGGRRPSRPEVVPFVEVLDDPRGPDAVVGPAVVGPGEDLVTINGPRGSVGRTKAPRVPRRTDA